MKRRFLTHLTTQLIKTHLLSNCNRKYGPTALYPLAMAASTKDCRPPSQTPYAHCRTRTIDLQLLDLPESASDEVYRRIYHSYTQSATSGSNASHLRDAIQSVKYGIAPPVAFPTETVYGLGADATNSSAVSGIFAAKGRPNDNHLIADVSSSEHLQHVLGEPVPEVYLPIIDKFWPGPLTILLPVPKDSNFAPNVHPAQKTIGFRMPSSKYARFFIAACDRPIAGPSANSSGKPSPTTAQHVMDDLNGKINFILDGGNCDVGVESTVVDGLHQPPLILRPGGVSLEDLRSVGGEWADTAIAYKTHDSPSAPSTPSSDQYVEDMNGAPRAPGMKYRHYSPSAQLVLFSFGAIQNGRVEKYLSALVSTQQPGCTPKRVGLISWNVPRFYGVPLAFKPDLLPKEQDMMRESYYEQCISTGAYGSKETGGSHVILFNVSVQPKITELAKELFGVLRLFDDLKCDYIIAEVIERRSGIEGSTGELWDAVGDRIGKAASERIEG